MDLSNSVLKLFSGLSRILISQLVKMSIPRYKLVSWISTALKASKTIGIQIACHLFHFIYSNALMFRSSVPFNSFVQTPNEVCHEQVKSLVNCLLTAFVCSG